MSIEVGQRHEIFQKPFTKEGSEGMATVKKIGKRHIDHVNCEVEFDDEPGSVYFRTIATEEGLS